ncbi:MAG: HD domain-containing protein [Asgard group archaeon]|nr:HD domain-containing protein [Asgard group archaeon]
MTAETSITDNKINLEMKRLNQILTLLLNEAKSSTVDKRDQTLEWSINHMFSCSQLAKLLAHKRGLDMELSGIAGAIHDIAIIRTGIFKDHGPAGAPMVREILEAYNVNYGAKKGELKEEEIELIVEATHQHTDKKNYTDHKFIELIKDADSLDRFLHSKDTYAFYSVRCRNSLKDLNIDFDEFK